MQIEKKHLRVPLVDLGAQYTTIGGEVEAAITSVLQASDFILGSHVQLFEEEFARYCDARCAIGVDSGLSGLELILRAYGIGPGDEVITAANTFIATALAISHAGARPVLVDCDPQTYTLDIARVEAAITSRTKAIMPVHLYGQPVDMAPLLDIARARGLVVVEDACQAHGARYHGRRVGSLGDAAAFSFYPGKNLGAYGDGGMVVTNDERLADALRVMRNYGQREKYHHITQGFNRRLDTLQAAVLRTKLPYLDGWNAARRAHARLYNQLLEVDGITIPEEAGYAESVWHLYVIRVENRDALKTHLASQGVSAGVHYPVPIHLQPAYQDLGYARGDFPVSETYAEQIISLPMYAECTLEMIEHVAETVREFVQAGVVQ